MYVKAVLISNFWFLNIQSERTHYIFIIWSLNTGGPWLEQLTYVSRKKFINHLVFEYNKSKVFQFAAGAKCVIVKITQHLKSH